jgi:hypothetical protein
LATIGAVVGFVGVLGSLAIVVARLVLSIIWLVSKAHELIRRAS